MKRAAAIAVTLAGLSTPAFATEWVNCGDAAGEASFAFLAGTLDVLSISALTVSVGEQVWASDVAYGPGDPVVVGQAFEDGSTILVDAMDAGLTARVAELRLFKTAEGDGPTTYGGTLRIPGYGAWAVSCSG